MLQLFKHSRPEPPILIPSKYVETINYNGLQGRVVILPARGNTKATIVLIGGQHSAHERSLAFAEFLQEFGTVHLIDLPGFGGMTSFAAVGMGVSYDNYADYLYTVLKSRGLTSEVTLFAVSVGTEFVTRMLQKHPDSQQWITKCVAFVGFSAAKDFNIPRLKLLSYRTIATVFSTRASAKLLSIILFNRFSIVVFTGVFSYFKRKMQAEDPVRKQQMVQMERYLWFVNDTYTHAKTSVLMFGSDMRTYSPESINVDFHNIVTTDDQYFATKEVRKSFRDLYTTYSDYYVKLGVHMPSMLSSKEEVKALFSDEVIANIRP